MEDILRDISAVVGVTGCFVCNEGGEVVASALPGVFDETILSNVGRTITQTIAGLELTRHRRADNLDLLYGGGRLVIKNLRPGCLIVLCVPTINVPLLNLTANTAARKLREELKEQVREVTPAEMGPSPISISPEELEPMSDFIESLIEELEKRGIGRDVMLKAVQHRLGRLRIEYPCLALVRVVGEKVDLSALQTAAFSDEDTGLALRALIQGICWSAIGILGVDAARAGYDLVYEPFRDQNEALIKRLGLEDILARAAYEESRPRLLGVEITW